MKNLVVALAVTLGLMQISCARRLGVGDRSPSGSGVSDVTMKFKDQLHPELRKRLAAYQLEITPHDETCKKTKAETAVKEARDWKAATDLVISKKVARNCTYLIKLAFGENKDEAGTKKFVAYFSNSVGRDGDTVKTETERVTAEVRLTVTEEGKKEGLDKYVGQIGSEPDTSLDLNILFSGSKLDGTYAMVCTSDNQATPKFRSRTVTIAAEKITVQDAFYAAAGCAADQLMYEEKGELVYNLGKRLASPKEGVEFFTNIKKKTLRVSPSYKGAYYCATQDLLTANPKPPVGQEVDLMTFGNAFCLTNVAGIGMYDIIDLQNNVLMFGKKEANLIGDTADTVPESLEKAVYYTLPKK